jgi:membrane fusion protein, multidrug efflux system
MPAFPDTDDTSADLHAHYRRRRRLWIGVIAVVLILGGLWLWHRHEAAVAAAAAAKRAAAVGVTITTATARKGDIGIYLEAIGTVTPVYTASITSQVNGVVTAVLFKEGQQVHKGDALIDIDPRPYQATLLQAQGALERDQNVLAQAQMDLERYRNALAKNAVASQTVDDQEKLVLQDQGTVKNDQGTVQYDQVQLEYCHIIAPISGQVGLRLVDPGNVVQSSGAATLAVITQMQPITVIFTLSEDSLGPVVARLRQQAQLSVDVFDRSAQKKIASGELLALDNQIDTTTGTVKVRAQFDNKDNALYPNQFVNTRLLVNTLQGVTLIPAAAVQQNGSTSFVYVIQNNVAALRNIKTGVTDGGVTQVDGIQPADVVATSGFDKLQDKAKVAVTATPPAPATTSGTQAP